MLLIENNDVGEISNNNLIKLRLHRSFSFINEIRDDRVNALKSVIMLVVSQL